MSAVAGTWHGRWLRGGQGTGVQRSLWLLWSRGGQQTPSMLAPDGQPRGARWRTGGRTGPAKRRQRRAACGGAFSGDGDANEAVPRGAACSPYLSEGCCRAMQISLSPSAGGGYPLCGWRLSATLAYSVHYYSVLCLKQSQGLHSLLGIGVWQHVADGGGIVALQHSVLLEQKSSPLCGALWTFGLLGFQTCHLKPCGRESCLYRSARYP